SADPILRTLVTQLVGQRADALIAPADRGPADLARHGGRLGAFFIRIIEYTDSIEARRGEEPLQLRDVSAGLARKANDHVAAAAGPGVKSPRGGEEVEEGGGGADPPHPA